jgi:DhnA family fructose-bisphosphate aldolase class Ia
MSVGGAGACVGRGVFTGPDVLGTLTELHAIIHGSDSLSRATPTFDTEASML